MADAWRTILGMEKALHSSAITSTTYWETKQFGAMVERGVANDLNAKVTFKRNENIISLVQKHINSKALTIHTTKKENYYPFWDASEIKGLTI